MKRCSLRAWIPIVPIPVWPLAWQCLLGQNTVVGSMRCSFWLCVEACQEEYVGIPIFTTSALHHGSGQRYPPVCSWTLSLNFQVIFWTSIEATSHCVIFAAGLPCTGDVHAGSWWIPGCETSCTPLS